MSSARDTTPTRAPQAGSVPAAGLRPRLLFFYARTSGPSRRVEGYLAQVLQRRANHATFAIHFVDADERTDLMERFAVDELPTLIVIEERQIRGRIVSPRGCRDIETVLAPWLH